jgi:hypothetical protein
VRVDYCATSCGPICDVAGVVTGVTVMVSCSKIRRQLEAVEYDLDRLPPETRAHVAECAACWDYATQMQSLRRLLAEQPRVLPPASFDAELCQRLRQDAHRFREPFLGWVPTPVLAAVAMVVVVASALAIRSSMQMVLHAPPSVTAALTLPTRPEQTLTMSLHPQLGGPSRPALVRTTPVVSRRGRMAPVTVRQNSLPAPQSEGVVVLWRGRSGERMLRLPPVVYGMQPIFDRRSVTEGESSDDSVF